MVDQPGIVWNQVWQWLDQVELLRQQEAILVRGVRLACLSNREGVFPECGVYRAFGPAVIHS